MPQLHRRFSAIFQLQRGGFASRASSPAPLDLQSQATAHRHVPAFIFRLCCRVPWFLLAVGSRVNGKLDIDFFHSQHEYSTAHAET